MLELMSRAAVLAWAACVFFRGLLAELSLLEGTHARPSPARRRQPAGYEWRRVNRLGGRLLAVQVRVIVA